MPGEVDVLPSRPLTVGETLDAAVALLRTKFRRLVVIGALIATGEQLLLAPLSWLANHLLDERSWHAVTAWSAWLVLGAGTESLALAILGVFAARAARDAVGGLDQASAHASATATPPGPGLEGATKTATTNIWPAALSLGVLIGAAAGLGAFLLGAPWLIVYGFSGLIIPALVIERLGAGRALSRGLGLTWRSSGRAFSIRLLGALAWLIVRWAVGCGGLALIAFALPNLPSWIDTPLGALPWIAINAVAYPALACLDVAIYVETRVRSEGLDLTLQRIRAARVLPAQGTR